MNQKLTSRDHAEIVKYYNAGAKQYEIAKHFGVSAMTISRVIKDYNVKKPTFNFRQ
jgi:transposase